MGISAVDFRKHFTDYIVKDVVDDVEQVVKRARVNQVLPANSKQWLEEVRKAFRCNLE